MTDETNVASATGADAPAPLKSTDTSVVKKTLETKPEPAKEPEKVEAPKVEQSDDDHDPEGVETDAPEADSEEQPKQSKSTWKKRLERVRRTTEAETRAAVLKELIDQGVIKSPEAKPEAPAQEQPTKKTLADFDYDEEAFLDYRLEQRLQQREAKQREEEDKKRQAEAADKFKARIEAFEDRVGEGAWDDIVASPLNRDPEYKALAELIRDEESGLEIAHFLASNPDKAEELTKLSPLRMAAEVAKIAEQISGKQPEKPAPVLPKKTTTAPPPPKTVSGSGRPSVDIQDPQMTTSQRIAEWRKQAKS